MAVAAPMTRCETGSGALCAPPEVPVTRAPPLLRLATPDDRPAVEAIVRAAYSPYIARMGRAPAPMGVEYGARIAAGQVHVIGADGGISGLIVLVPEPASLLLDIVAVAPEAQGRGLGGLLLAFAERSARAQGYAAIRLYTNAAMTENLSLYAHLGYDETHRAEEDGFQRVHLRKRLGAPD